MFLLNIVKRNSKPVDHVISKEVMGEILSLSEGDVFIDCGANIGQQVQFAGPTGATIYAFEPNPFAFRKLKKVARKFKSVYCYQSAVLNKESKMRLYLHQNSNNDNVFWSQSSSLNKNKSNNDINNYIEVEVIDLPKFIKQNNIKKIKLIKIDIEGAEYDLLRGLIDNEIYKIVDKIFVETHEDKIPSLVEQDKKLRQELVDKNITNIFLDWQ